MAGEYKTYLQLFLIAAVLLGLSTAAQFSGSSEIARLRSKQQTKSSDGYGPVLCVPGTPQLPNYIQPMQIDPKRILGKWYRSSQWFPGVETSSVDRVNIITTYNNLFNDSLTIFPGSNTPAAAFEQLIAYYDMSRNRCGNGSYGALEYATVDGQLRGMSFLQGIGNAGIDTTLVLSTDYDTYILYYTCGVYDVTSGMCASPDVTADTRQPANLVPSSTLNAINDAVSRVLGPYCLNPDMLRIISPPLGSVTDCQFLAVPRAACYKSLRDAYLYLGDPNFAN